MDIRRLGESVQQQVEPFVLADEAEKKHDRRRRRQPQLPARFGFFQRFAVGVVNGVGGETDDRPHASVLPRWEGGEPCLSTRYASKLPPGGGIGGGVHRQKTALSLLHRLRHHHKIVAGAHEVFLRKAVAGAFSCGMMLSTSPVTLNFLERSAPCAAPCRGKGPSAAARNAR